MKMFWMLLVLGCVYLTAITESLSDDHQLNRPVDDNEGMIDRAVGMLDGDSLSREGGETDGDIHKVRKSAADSDSQSIALGKTDSLHKTLPTTSPPNKHKVTSMIDISDVYFIAIVSGCSVAGLIGLILAVVCWIRYKKRVKAAEETEYPAYGVTGPMKEPEPSTAGDRKLAQSAQMYHYQHQKQQMIALNDADNDVNKAVSGGETEEENEEGEYTVYEYPGLASTGDLEVRNPLFSDLSQSAPRHAESPPEPSEKKEK